MLPRALAEPIRADLDSKMVLLAGPRQAGKSTLGKSLFSHNVHLNYDRPQDRATMREQSWQRDTDLVVFDELHKMPTWKRWLKGVYDAEGNNPRLLVTGSARLDTFRRGGDSLAGRFF